MFATNEPKSNVWAHYKPLFESCFPLMSPSPTLGSIINNLRPYKYLELRIIKDNYKSTSFKGSSPQAHKLQRYNPTNFKDKPTSFKRSSPQAYKLQRYNFTNCKDKLTSFKRIKPTSP